MNNKSINENYVDNILRYLPKPVILDPANGENKSRRSTIFDFFKSIAIYLSSGLCHIANKIFLHFRLTANAIFGDGIWYDERKARGLVVEYVSNPACRDKLKSCHKKIAEIYDRLVNLSNGKEVIRGMGNKLFEIPDQEEIIFDENEDPRGGELLLNEELDLEILKDFLIPPSLEEINALFADGTCYDERKARGFVFEYVSNPACREQLKSCHKQISEIYDRLVNLSNGEEVIRGMGKKLFEVSYQEEIIFDENEDLRGELFIEELDLKILKDLFIPSSLEEINANLGDGTWYDERKAREFIVEYVSNPACREKLKSCHKQISEIYDRLVNLSNGEEVIRGMGKKFFEVPYQEEIFFDENEDLRGELFIEELDLKILKDLFIPSLEEEIFDLTDTLLKTDSENSFGQSYVFSHIDALKVPTNKYLFHIHADEFGASSTLEGWQASEAIQYLQAYLEQSNKKHELKAPYSSEMIEELGNAFNMLTESPKIGNSEKETCQKNIERGQRRIREAFEYKKSLLIFGGWVELQVDMLSTMRSFQIPTIVQLLDYIIRVQALITIPIRKKGIKPAIVGE
ncbi:MAG: hypothetical protein H0W50_09495 [Parachlamydiaceae bacterium]|nr:hypothetical protein [Parachlamydiaceae bacterium]